MKKLIYLFVLLLAIQTLMFSTAEAAVSPCGNGLLDEIPSVEECDDGNILTNDGCNSECLIESDYFCRGEPSTCVANCNDAIVYDSCSEDGCLVDSKYYIDNSDYLYYELQTIGTPDLYANSYAMAIDADMDGVTDWIMVNYILNGQLDVSIFGWNNDAWTWERTASPDEFTFESMNEHLIMYVDNANVVFYSKLTYLDLTADSEFKVSFASFDALVDFEGISIREFSNGFPNIVDWTESGLAGIDANFDCIGYSPPAICGNAIPEGDEECDDGNEIDNDTCFTTCILNICGDGALNEGAETCDDGNVLNGDGCAEDCLIEPKLNIKTTLFDIIGRNVAETYLKNIGYIQNKIWISDIIKSTDDVDIQIYDGKNHEPIGRTTINYLGAQMCEESVTTCLVGNAYIIDETCVNSDYECHCVCKDDEFNEEKPWVSVYGSEAFSTQTLTWDSSMNYSKIFSLELYKFSDCIVSGDAAICPIKAYFEHTYNVFEVQENVEINLFQEGIPDIVYSVNSKSDSIVSIVPDEYTQNIFDASKTKYKLPACYGGSECYMVDTNQYLNYEWYIDVHNLAWGETQLIENIGLMCVPQDVSKSECLSPFVCDGSCAEGVACTCEASARIYTGYVSEEQVATYTFNDDSVCGDAQRCAVSLTVTDPTTLMSNTKEFGIILTEEEIELSDSPYGSYSQSCDLGGIPIFTTSYCCKSGYIVNPEFNEFIHLFEGDWLEACIEKPNELPIPSIKQPDDDEEFIAGTRIYFRAEATDHDGTISAYLWDFGDRSEPWGFLDVESDGDLICKKQSSSKKCDESDAITIDEFEEDEEIPCSCDNKYGSDILNLYPNSASDKQKVFHTYKDKFACTEYDDDDTNECEVSLWVFDDDNDSRKITLDLELVRELSDNDDDDDGSSFYCGDGLVTDDEECDMDVVDACDSGICTSACICEAVIAGSDVIVKDDSEDRFCGNDKCEFGENSANCLLDCPTGDNTGAIEPSESDEGSNLPVILIIILAIVGILFLLYKKGYDFSKFLPAKLFGGKLKTKEPDMSLDMPMTASPTINTAESGLSDYITSTRKKGYSYTQIKEALEKKGWKEDKINEIFSKVGLP